MEEICQGCCNMLLLNGRSWTFHQKNNALHRKCKMLAWKISDLMIYCNSEHVFFPPTRSNFDGLKFSKENWWISPSCWWNPGCGCTPESSWEKHFLDENWAKHQWQFRRRWRARSPVFSQMWSDVFRIPKSPFHSYNWFKDWFGGVLKWGVPLWLRKPPFITSSKSYLSPTSCRSYGSSHGQFTKGRNSEEFRIASDLEIGHYWRQFSKHSLHTVNFEL